MEGTAAGILGGSGFGTEELDLVRLGVLLGEEIDDSNNNGVTHRGDSVGRSSFVGSLGHTLAE